MTTSLLIAVKSCQRDRTLGFHKAIRETWASGLPLFVDVRFFMGFGDESKYADETSLNCPDDYQSLPLKTKAIAKWFLDSEYDKIFLCDNDTYIDVPGLIKYPWQQVDYAGRFSFWPTDAKIGTTFRYDDGLGNVHDPCYSWASGGYGYFLSKKTAKIVADMRPCSWAEDLSVGQVLGPLIVSKEIVARNFEYSDKCVWHIAKGRDNPFIPKRIYDYYKGNRP